MSLSLLAGTTVCLYLFDRQKNIALGYNNRGFIRYNRVDFDEAIEDYTDALKFDQSLYFTYYNRGLIHYRLGRFNKLGRCQVAITFTLNLRSVLVIEIF